MYEELVKRLRASVDGRYEKCDGCPYEEDYPCCVDCLDKMHKQAADAIEELEHHVFLADLACKAEAAKAPRWIPVSERLPQEWWPVLGLIQYHDEKEPPAQQVLWYLGNGHWRETWRGDMIESDVTHWMPLPEPPKEE